ncbi:MAG TPA: hypothetical protein VMR70_07035 [Flavisolibacter sp.]|nr:hypothetical protein [Flavisolibacter sp.]
MRLHAYFQSAESILSQYDGAVPFAIWLKNYFKQNKKFGSRDRKVIARICFAYFRTGKALENLPISERLQAAMTIIHPEKPQLRELLKPAWQELLDSPNRVTSILPQPSLIFSFAEEVSAEINEPAFFLSHLVLPDLFLRIRPGKKEVVQKKLQAAGIPFSMEDDCIRLSNATKIDDVLLIDEEVVVQDKSSQQVLNGLQLQTPNAKPQTFTAWDCCAASGGKSILLHDHFPKAQLAVSDIRESILHNLRSRFKRAGISSYQSFVADVSSDNFRSSRKYDVVICDAPCSGSGTWGRTPEQLVFFQQERIAHYTSLQKSIAVNASKSLKEGGWFVYITCSVFKKENEDVVDYILQNSALKLQQQQYVKGYTQKADTLFVSIFRL